MPKLFVNKEKVPIFGNSDSTDSLISGLAIFRQPSVLYLLKTTDNETHTYCRGLLFNDNAIELLERGNSGKNCIFAPAIVIAKLGRAESLHWI
ncbi:MAG: hypothetical protein J6M31_09035 [Bacteroidales bacterium]|nr:hypothetical protein [Bacteroidales bacterium]